MENAKENVIGLITTYGLDVVAAIVILIVGLIAARWAQRLVAKGCAKSGRIDETLTGFFANLTYYAVVAVVVIAVLARFGIETTSLIAVFGAAGLAIGLALQGTLSNVAAGVMLLMFRPFKIGDFIDAGGQSGTVKEVGLFTTEMATPDNVKIKIGRAHV